MCTSWSFDAYIFGNHLTGPAEACGYATGQPIKHSMGYEIKIRTPLDWTGVCWTGKSSLRLMGVGLPGIEVGIALSAIALGCALFAEVKPRLWGVAALVVGFFAIFHGHADGSDVPTGANGLLYSMGLVVAKGTWHAAGIGMGLIYQWPLGRVSLRAAGAVVALAGATFLWRAIAPRGTL